MVYRALALATLCLTQVGVARAQCVREEQALDCCAMFQVQANYDPDKPVGAASDKCHNRPSGTVCYAFSDGYVWLLPGAQPTYAEAHCPDGIVHILFEEQRSSAWNGAMHLHLDGTTW